MTTEALNEFTNALRSDEAMAKGLVAALDGKQGGAAVETIAAYARGRGYGVDSQDAATLLAAAHGDGALSDEQLDGVAGGGGGFLGWLQAPGAAYVGALQGAVTGLHQGLLTGVVEGWKKSNGG